MRRTAGRARRHECRCRESAREEQRRARPAAVRRSHEPEDSIECGDLGEGAESLAPSRRLCARTAPGGADRSSRACWTARCCRRRWSCRRRRSDHGPDELGQRRRRHDRRHLQHALASSDAAKPTSAAISGGTSWGDDGVDLKLVTQELEPLFNPQNQPNGFVAVGGNDTGESSNFTVHVLCFTG